MPKLGLSLVTAILASAISFSGPLAAPYSIYMSAQEQPHKPKVDKQPSGVRQRTIQQRSVIRPPTQQRMIQRQRFQQPRFTQQPKVQQQTIQRRRVTQQPGLQQRTTQQRQITQQPKFRSAACSKVPSADSAAWGSQSDLVRSKFGTPAT